MRLSDRLWLVTLKTLQLLGLALATALAVFPQAAKQTPPKAAPKATTQKKPTAKKTTAKATTAKKPAAKPSAAKKPVAKRRTTARRRAPAVRTPPRQTTPTTDRVLEIQQALAERGYPVTPTGKWGPDSVAALKKFQEDHDINNLSGRGKLDPLTLIALGLGPKHESTGPAPPEATNPNQEGHQP